MSGGRRQSGRMRVSMSTCVSVCVRVCRSGNRLGNGERSGSGNVVLEEFHSERRRFR